MMTPVIYVADEDNDRRRDWITVRMTAVAWAICSGLSRETRLI